MGTPSISKMIDEINSKISFGMHDSCEGVYVIVMKIQTLDVSQIGFQHRHFQGSFTRDSKQFGLRYQAL